MNRDIHRGRLSEQIARILAEVLAFESKDPVIQAALPAVTEVELSPDGQWATVRLQVGSDRPMAEVEEALARDRGFLRRELAHRLKVRRVPEIRFRLEPALPRSSLGRTTSVTRG